jgi:hypothetical protein
MTRSTWTPTRFYPVEGDSAIFELEHSSGLFLEIWLEGINLAAEGTARMTGARVMVHVHGTDRSGSVELDELTAHLAEGRQWLLDNERGRLP